MSARGIVGAGLGLLLALGVGVPGCGGATEQPNDSGTAGDEGEETAGAAHAGSASVAGRTNGGTDTGRSDATADGGAINAGSRGGDVNEPGGSGGATGGDASDPGGGGDDPIVPGNGQAGASGELPIGESYRATDCNGHQVDLNPDWVKYCVVLSGCLGEDPAWCLMSPQAGYDFYFQFDVIHGPPYVHAQPGHERFELTSCEKQLSTCDDLLACSGSRRLQAECDINKKARCEGERAINCATKLGVSTGVQNCERLSGKPGTCQVVGTGVDARALCVVKATCNAPGTQTCDGDKVVSCDATGVGGGEDCTQFGLKCRAVGATAFCAPPLPTETCDQKGAPFCDGNAVAYCNPDGIPLKGPDCGTVGDLVCSGGGADTNGDDWWDCVPRGCSMTNWDGGFQECQGNDSVSDMGWWRVRIRCADYGLTCKGGACAQ